MASEDPAQPPSSKDLGMKGAATPTLPAAQPQPLSEYFGNIRVLGELLRDNVDRPWLTTMPNEAPHHQYVVWLGCNMVRTAHLAEVLDDILKSLGTDFVSLGGPSHCCGIMHEGRGETAVANNLLRNTLRKVDAFTPEQLLVWCPSCDNQIATRDQSTISAMGKERGRVAEFLDRAVPSERLGPVPMTVLGLLSRIPGLSVMDMPSADGLGRHCTLQAMANSGGRDGYRQRMLEWDMEARRRGATHTVSVYHSCHRQLLLLQRGAADAGFLPVVNYLTLLARSLGLPEREDKFARLSQIDDMERMVGEVSGQAEALAIKPEQVRRALVDQFERRS
jgi:hypothetical protein